MKTLLCLLLLGSWLNAQNLDEARLASLSGNHAIAVTKYHLALQKLPDHVKGKVHLEIALNYLEMGTSSPNYFDQAQNEIDTLLTKLEPEDSLYFPTLLFQAWTQYQRNLPEEAQKQWLSAQEYLTRADQAINLWMGYLLFYQTTPDEANQRRSQLITQFPYSPEALHLQQMGSSPNLNKNQTDKTPSSDLGDWALQLGAFGVKSNAEKVADGYNPLPKPYHTRIALHPNKALFIVQIVGFKNREEANDFALKELDLVQGKFLIVQP